MSYREELRLCSRFHPGRKLQDYYDLDQQYPWKTSVLICYQEVGPGSERWVTGSLPGSVYLPLSFPTSLSASWPPWHSNSPPPWPFCCTALCLSLQSMDWNFWNCYSKQISPLSFRVGYFVPARRKVTKIEAWLMPLFRTSAPSGYDIAFKSHMLQKHWISVASSMIFGHWSQ